MLADSRPGSGTVVLRTDGVELRVTAVEVRERPGDFVAHARHKFSRDDDWAPGTPQEIRTTGGLSGERGDLRPAESSGKNNLGCYAIFTAEDLGVVVTVSPVGDCASVPPATWAAVDSLTTEGSA